jgi:hypothetical protein
MAAYGHAQSLRDHDEHLVARDMGVVVVDVLEPVQVDEHEAQQRARPRPPGQRVMQPLEQHRAVGHAGERVLKRQLLEPSLRLLGPRPQRRMLDRQGGGDRERFQRLAHRRVRPLAVAGQVDRQHAEPGAVAGGQRREQRVLRMPGVGRVVDLDVGDPVQPQQLGVLAAVIEEVQTTPALAGGQQLVPHLGRVNGAEQRRTGSIVASDGHHLQRPVRSHDVDGGDAEAEGLYDRLGKQIKHGEEVVRDRRHEGSGVVEVLGGVRDLAPSVVLPQETTMLAPAPQVHATS